MTFDCCSGSSFGGSKCEEILFSDFKFSTFRVLKFKGKTNNKGKFTYKSNWNVTKGNY